LGASCVPIFFFVGKTDFCNTFLGDGRVNFNPDLTSLQVIFLREHNRLAQALSRLNPTWNDETLYQEARRIAIAEVSQISKKLRQTKET